MVTFRKAICVTSAVVIPLSVVQHLFLSALLFYVLFPGSIVELLITGGHGGTKSQEAIAPIVGAVVNVLVYALGLYGLVRLLKFTDSK